MKKLRVYADTSVFGGCFDEEFRRDSSALMELVREGRLLLLLSDVVIRELEGAPQDVQNMLRSLSPEAVEVVDIDEEVIALRDAYLAAGILTPRWIDDAAHVAAATCAHADAIVSWNFSHIVRLEKMKAYNQVNLLQGYGILTIVTPREVIPDDRDG